MITLNINTKTARVNAEPDTPLLWVLRDTVKLTGTKPDKKLYRHHTLFPGGIRTRIAKEVLANDPEHAIYEAVWGMMPKGPLGRRIIKKMKIYKGGEHEHSAQKPRVLEIKN